MRPRLCCSAMSEKKGDRDEYQRAKLRSPQGVQKSEAAAPTRAGRRSTNFAPG